MEPMFNWFKRKPPDDIECMAWLVRAVERQEPEWQSIHIRRKPEGGVEYYIATNKARAGQQRVG
jgi:hypothetical protein